MKKIIVFLAFIAFMFFFNISCSNLNNPKIEVGKVANLADIDLFEATRGDLENWMRENSSGNYAEVIVILGECDSVLAYDKNTAKKIATLDAKNQLADYMNTSILAEDNFADLVRNIEKDVNEQYGNKVEIFDERDINTVLKTFKGSFSSTQLSSVLVEKVQYRDAKNAAGIPYVEARVLCTISDRVVSEIQKLISIAFQNNEKITNETVEIQRAWIDSAKEMTCEKFLNEVDNFFN